MDDRRFDSLVKAMATGTNRRSLFKGLLGLGGVAVVGTSLQESNVDAAPRPTPTPKPPLKCPGRQVPVGGVCKCPGTAPDKCGPDCCTNSIPPPNNPTYSECCDNACCFGTCYGEELCCATNTRPGGLPPTHIVCEGPTGPTCVPGNCCDDSDCGDPCQRCDVATHTCVARCDEASEVCCTEQAGPGVCVTGDCCLGAPCTVEAELQGICCQAAAGTLCVNAETCPTQCSEINPCAGCATCVRGLCLESCGDDEICCDEECLSTSEFFACPADEATCCAVADACCNVDGCCSGACYGGNSGRDLCCDRTTEVYCQPATGPAQCCPNAATDKCCGTVGCCSSSQCNEEANVCCSEGSFACGTTEGNLCCGSSTEKCCEGVCIDASECCAANGDICPTCEPNCDCSIEANDGLDCNGGLAAGGGVCACGYCVVPLDGCPCGCAGDTECVRCAGNGVCETYNQGGSCNGGAGICQDEWCVDPPPPSCEPNCDCSIEANDGLACNGGGDAVCGCGYCIIPLGDCLCGCDGDTECVACEGGQCVEINQGVACNGGDGVCIGAYCNECLPLSEPCGVDGQCCSGLCDQGICVTCKLPGGTCNEPGDCCSFVCSGGFCLAP